VDETYENVIDINALRGGTYQGIISRFDFFDSKKTGDVFLKTEIAFAHEPEYEGQQVEAIHNLTDSDKLKLDQALPVDHRLRGELADPLGRPGAVRRRAGGVRHRLLRQEERLRRHYMNVYVNRRLEVGEACRRPEFQTTPVDDDDIPF
jgi:hypothetical protein